MPQVPYQPVPDVSPEDRVAYAPQIAVHTDADMFGANIGRAVEHLGGTMSQVSNELFSRALALQELRNETEATDANAAAQQKGATQLEGFKALEGKNAVAGLPKFQQGIEALRQETIQGLSNPDAIRRFNNEFRSFQTRMDIYAGEYAGSQNKIWINGAAESAKQAALDDLAAHPNDPQAVASGLQKLRDATQQQGDVHGWDDTQTKQEINRWNSRGIRAVGEGLNLRDPIKAKQFIQDNSDNLHYTDREALEAKNQVGFRNAITRQAAGNFAPYLTESERDRIKSVQKPLQWILQKAMEDNPDLRIHVDSGYRSTAEQADIYARSRQGRLFAAAPPGQSNHEKGLAVDLTPGTNTSYADIQRAMYGASRELGIPFSPEHQRLGARDRGHYSIPNNLSGVSAPSFMPVDQRAAWNRRFVEAMAPDDPFVGDVAEQRTATANALQTRLLDQQRQVDMDAIQAKIRNAGNGEPSPDLETVLSDPRLQAAFDRIGESPGGPAKQIELQRQIKSINALVQSDPLERQRLQGLAKSDDPEDWNRFQKEDILSNPSLSRRDKDRFSDMQIAARRAPPIEPKITAAMNELKDANILSPEVVADKDTMAILRGAMYDQIQVYEQATGQFPKPERIREMGQRLLLDHPAMQEQAQRGAAWNDIRGIINKQLEGFAGMSNYWLGGGEDQGPLIARTVPAKELEDIKRDWAKSHNGAMPNDSMIKRIYVDKLYQDLYGKSKSGAAR